MKYTEQRESFKRLMIQQGVSKMEQLEQALPFGCNAPSRLVDKWLDKMLTLPEEFSSQRRYVNRFKLGADPEFVFVSQGERRDARQFELQQGLAFGMDNNGRLVEIRPHPSRSAVNVVASVLATMRWLATLYPKTLLYDWVAGAFICGDGLGGHVHFGRKRPNRDIEVKALDVIEEELLAIKAYPLQEIARRRQGDGHQQRYGLPSDIRKQIHGYEYRTFPSWLDSPELAFLTITLSKLAVHNPGLIQGYIPLDLNRHYQRLRNLLAYYKDMDDDARLALKILARKLPVHIGGDFKKRWGIETVTPLSPPPMIQFIPASVKPNSDDVKEMFEYLDGNKTLGMRTPTPTWGPLVPPEGYKMSIEGVNTHMAKGLGELLWDVCQHKSFTYPFGNIRDYENLSFLIPEKLAATLPDGWNKMCGNQIMAHRENVIYSVEHSRKPETFRECRRLLLETVLPFWQISKVKPDSWQQWNSGLRKKPRLKFEGKLLYGELAAMPPELR
jgi:hypothetical protein